MRVARLSAALGGGFALLIASWLACGISCFLAARLGVAIAAGLSSEAKAMLVAITLLLGAGELLVRRAGRTPVEPTRSFGAILLVLGAAQLTAATGLLVVALAGASGTPW